MAGIHDCILGQSSAHKLDVLVHTYNPSPWEVEVGGSEDQYHSWLIREFQDSLGYLRPCFK